MHFQKYYTYYSIVERVINVNREICHSYHFLKTKKPAIASKLLKYSGWELNPHSPYSEQDFKSCVSTSSTTRVDASLLLPAVEKKSR